MGLDQTRFLMGALAVLLAGSSMGGGLGDLKKETEKKAARRESAKSEPESKPEKTHRYDSYNSSFGSGTYPTSASGNGFLTDFWGWLVAGPFAYRADDPSASMSPTEEGWADDQSGGLLRPNHQYGQAVMPYVRVDANWQYIDSDNDAIDGRLELGYKVAAFHVRTTSYADALADLDQTVNQYYAVLRYGGEWPELFPGTAEIAIGIGVAQHNGDLSDDSSAALTFPLKYHPTDWLGVEFRPAWYQADFAGIEFDIGDYDLSASLGYRWVQLRAGYRWLWFSSIGHMLDGPYAGVSFSF